jgi:cold shock CspA family protein
LASIRLKGKINKWVDDKGFGFITPEKNTKNIFVHISAFDRAIPRRPKVGDTIFYHVKTDKNGKTKAVDASIEGVAPVSKKTYTSRPRKQFRERRPRNSWGIFVLCIALLIGAGSTIFNYFQSGSIQKVSAGIQHSNTSNSSRYTCKGKTRCSEMTSCEEAEFYIRNCPGTKMDGDGDGVPCESQWCN